MTWDHQRVEELMALHALGGLDGEDAALAERALVEHVPGCELCRAAVEGFRGVAGDLALVAEPVAPPDALTARVRRVARGGRSRAARLSWVAGVAAAVVVLGLSAFNLVLAGRLTDRLGDAERQQSWIVDAVSTLGQPDRVAIPLSGPRDARVSVLYVPGEDQLYVLAANLPDPRFGYHVWFVGDQGPWHGGELQVTRGVGMLPIRTQATRWQVVMITDEPRGGPEPEASPLVSASVS